MLARALDRLFPARKALYEMGTADAAKLEAVVRSYVGTQSHSYIMTEVKATLANVLKDHFRGHPAKYAWHGAYLRGVVDGLRTRLKDCKQVSFWIMPRLLVTQWVEHDYIPKALLRVNVTVRRGAIPKETPYSVTALPQRRRVGR